MPEKPPELVVPRPDEATPLGEMAMARGWLNHLRGSALFKVEGLDDDQLRWRPTPAANSLGVLVVHLGYTERLWVRAIAAGEPMDMGWRSQMFELPAVGSGRGHGLLPDRVSPRRRRAGPSCVPRPAVGGRFPAHDLALGRLPPDRGGGSTRRPHGHHPRAPRRPHRALNPPRGTPNSRRRDGTVGFTRCSPGNP